MRKITSNHILADVNGGSLSTFCAGMAVGSGLALSLGISVGPVGWGALFVTGALCLLGDSGY